MCCLQEQFHLFNFCWYLLYDSERCGSLSQGTCHLVGMAVIGHILPSSRPIRKDPLKWGGEYIAEEEREVIPN